MTKKWLYIAGAVVLLIVVILAWKFAADIRLWLADIFVDLIILVITFCTGWLIGRYGGKKRRTAAVDKNE